LVIGEGEQTIKDLIKIDFNIDDNDIKKIKGIGLKQNGEVIITENREPLKTPLELVSISPLYKTNLEQIREFYIQTQNKLNRGWDIAATRGCYGECVFCKKIFSKPIRSFSPEYIIEKIKYIKKNYNIDRFNFLDENFATNNTFFKSFLRILDDENINIKWGLRSRLDNIPANYLDKMMKLGLYRIMVGVESGSQANLNYYKKNIVIDKYKPILRDLSERRLLYASFVIGSEIETKETIRENIDLIKYIKLDKKSFVVCFLSVIPGTQLFENLYQRGLIQDKYNYIDNFIGNFLNLEWNITKMTDDQLYKSKEKMLQACN